MWYDLKKLLWQDELNPRVRCAFGNVWGLHCKPYTGLECDVIQQAINIYGEISLEMNVCLPEKIFNVFIFWFSYFSDYLVSIFVASILDLSKGAWQRGFRKTWTLVLLPKWPHITQWRILGFPRSYIIFQNETNQKKDRKNLSKNENRIVLNIQTSNKIG